MERMKHSGCTKFYASIICALVLAIWIALGFIWVRQVHVNTASVAGTDSVGFQHRQSRNPPSLKQEAVLGDLVDLLDHFERQRQVEHDGTRSNVDVRDCTMSLCFNFTRCGGGTFRVFVYPEDKQMSPIYVRILQIVRLSGFLTEDPAEACIFILGSDTLDRDKLSEQYVNNINERIREDPLVHRYWDKGRNHLVFNLYSGTFPDYSEVDIGFDIGYAIVAKASMSGRTFRKDFDISLPLFHYTLPFRGEEAGYLSKSTRYPGSDSRNSLYHIHNGQDVVILTTCRHGKQLKELRDERCDQDDLLYDKYDYQTLLDNTTFCLVPRGRRLGSFRFLESLQAGCIPVILSNDWELPFSEIIDWNKAVVFADERLLTQIPSLVRSISFDQILFYRQQTQLLWRQYFSSIERIVQTTMEIVRDRLSSLRRSKELWNTWPALTMAQMTHLQRPDFNMAFVRNLQNPRLYARQNVTVLVKLTTKQNFGTSFVRLLKALNRLAFVAKVIVLSPWREATINALKGWTWIRLPVVTVSSQKTAGEMKTMCKTHVQTEGLLLLHDDCGFGWEEIDYGFHVWKSFPERIVGFHAASHFWDEPSESWMYSSKLTNEYSMVSMNDGFFHIQYYLLVWHYKGMIVTAFPEECTDILANFIVSRITRLPPLRLTRKDSNNSSTGQSDLVNLFTILNGCINELIQSFGYVSLVRSSVVFNPVLYKDTVSSYRKKYRQLELLQ